MRLDDGVFTPVRRDTEVVSNGRVWIPSTAKSLIQELQGIRERAFAQDHVALFRGHADFNWCLDSTIARTIKESIFGFKPGEIPTDDCAADRFFSQTLYGAFLFKCGGAGRPSHELMALAESDDGIDPWFEWMKHQQQFPDKDHRTLKGSFLIDWTVSECVASWFATAPKTPSCPAAVFVADISASGSVHATGKLRSTLDAMEQHDWQERPFPGLPLLFCPPKQTLMVRANAQQARYLAQMDLRWPIDHVWRAKEAEVGERIYIKVKIKSALRSRMRKELEALGMTETAIFPDCA